MHKDFTRLSYASHISIDVDASWFWIVSKYLDVRDDGLGEGDDDGGEDEDNDHDGSINTNGLHIIQLVVLQLEKDLVRHVHLHLVHSINQDGDVVEPIGTLKSTTIRLSWWMWQTQQQ